MTKHYTGKQIKIWFLILKIPWQRTDKRHAKNTPVTASKFKLEWLKN